MEHWLAAKGDITWISHARPRNSYDIYDPRGKNIW